jgi:hypothetical protein
MTLLATAGHPSVAATMRQGTERRVSYMARIFAEAPRIPAE